MSKKRNSKKFRKKLRNRANSTKNSFRKKVEYDTIILNGEPFHRKRMGYHKEPTLSNVLSDKELSERGISNGYDDLELYNDIVIIKTDITNNLNNLTEAVYETFYKEISGIIESDDELDELDEFGLDDGIDDIEEEPEKSIYSSDSEDVEDVEDDEDDKKIDNTVTDSDELVLTDEEL